MQAVASIYALRACTGHSNSGVPLSCGMLKRASWIGRLERASGSTLGRNATFGQRATPEPSEFHLRHVLLTERA